MSFIPLAQSVARQVMGAIAPELVDRYGQIVDFLADHPAAACVRRSGSPEVGSEAYIRLQAAAFASSRAPRLPAPPATVPDDIVSVILASYFAIPLEHTRRIGFEHQLSMAAENMVGDLLERYLASVLEPLGWVWCSGAVVRAVDFIRAPARTGQEWSLLQVKNRDNSENSSSSAIRLGTRIEKWHRTFSRTGATNWAAFPDEAARASLSEAAFKSFVSAYLSALRCAD